MDLTSLLGARSVDDMLAERVRIQLGGVTYTLPVKTMRGQREWEEALDGELASLLRLVQDDGDDVEALLRALSGSSWAFIDLLLSYDDHDILPDRATVDETNTETAILVATLEVWRAGHPKADIGLGLFALRELMLDSASQARMSSLSSNGAMTIDGSRPN